jgi:tRNA(Ile)-lysidine synthase
VLVAVSGGPDSVALLHALHTLRDELGITLAVGNFDHGLRGEESAADSLYVRALSDELSLPFLLTEAAEAPLGHPAAVGPSPSCSNSAPSPGGASVEMRAREARYHALCDQAIEWGADRIATGHTLSDQAETVLLRVTLGTGLDGLAGIPRVGAHHSTSGQEVIVVRPLLGCSRGEVEAYCEVRGLAARQDSSNLCDAFRRNRVRSEILPLLRERLNPRAEESLARLADLARDDAALLAALADRAWETARLPSGDGDWLLQDTRLWPGERALQRRLLRRALLEAAPHHSPHHADIERLLDLLASGSPGATEVHPGLRVSWRRGILSVEPNRRA